MKVFNYNKEGYFIGTYDLDNSDKCPITGNWLIPGMATEKEPPLEKEGFEIKFIENDWKYIKLLTTEEKKIQGLIPLEEGEIIENKALARIPSPGEFYSWNFDNCEWFYDESKKQAKISEINQKAYQDIILKYPEWKQINITRMKDYNSETQLEFEKMITFIDEIRAYADYEVMSLE